MRGQGSTRKAHAVNNVAGEAKWHQLRRVEEAPLFEGDTQVDVHLPRISQRMEPRSGSRVSRTQGVEYAHKQWSCTRAGEIARRQVACLWLLRAMGW